MNKFLITFLLALVPGLTYANDKITKIKPIELSSLEKYKGRQISLFSLSAREPAIGVPGEVLVAREVHVRPQTSTINNEGSVNFKSYEVKVTNFRRFNYVAFVIHRDRVKEIFWRNLDGTNPIDPRTPEDFDWSKVIPEQINGELYFFIKVPELLEVEGPIIRLKANLKES